MSLITSVTLHSNRMTWIFDYYLNQLWVYHLNFCKQYYYTLILCFCPVFFSLFINDKIVPRLLSIIFNLSDLYRLFTTFWTRTNTQNVLDIFAVDCWEWSRSHSKNAKHNNYERGVSCNHVSIHPNVLLYRIISHCVNVFNINISIHFVY